MIPGPPPAPVSRPGNKSSSGLHEWAGGVQSLRRRESGNGGGGGSSVHSARSTHSAASSGHGSVVPAHPISPSSQSNHSAVVITTGAPKTPRRTHSSQSCGDRSTGDAGVKCVSPSNRSTSTKSTVSLKSSSNSTVESSTSEETTHNNNTPIQLNPLHRKCISPRGNHSTFVPDAEFEVVQWDCGEEEEAEQDKHVEKATKKSHQLQGFPAPPMTPGGAATTTTTPSKTPRKTLGRHSLTSKGDFAAFAEVSDPTLGGSLSVPIGSSANGSSKKHKIRMKISASALAGFNLEGTEDPKLVNDAVKKWKEQQKIAVAAAAAAVSPDNGGGGGVRRTFSCSAADLDTKPRTPRRKTSSSSHQPVTSLNEWGEVAAVGTGGGSGENNDQPSPGSQHLRARSISGYALAESLANSLHLNGGNDTNNNNSSRHNRGRSDKDERYRGRSRSRRRSKSRSKDRPEDDKKLMEWVNNPDNDEDPEEWSDPEQSPGKPEQSPHKPRQSDRQKVSSSKGGSSSSGSKPSSSSSGAAGSIGGTSSSHRGRAHSMGRRMGRKKVIKGGLTASQHAVLQQIAAENGDETTVFDMFGVEWPASATPSSRTNSKDSDAAAHWTKELAGGTGDDGFGGGSRQAWPDQFHKDAGSDEESDDEDEDEEDESDEDEDDNVASPTTPSKSRTKLKKLRSDSSDDDDNHGGEGGGGIVADPAYIQQILKDASITKEQFKKLCAAGLVKVKSKSSGNVGVVSSGSKVKRVSSKR